MNDLPKPSCEVSYGFLFLLQDSLQGADVHFLTHRTKIFLD